MMMIIRTSVLPLENNKQQQQQAENIFQFKRLRSVLRYFQLLPLMFIFPGTIFHHVFEASIEILVKGKQMSRVRCTSNGGSHKKGQFWEG